MNADYALTTGHSHYVCEDYAASGVDGKGDPFVLVSDGCSMSPFTDIGSRFVVRSAAQFLEQDDFGRLPPDFHSLVAKKALDLTRQLSLPIGSCAPGDGSTCDATLLTIRTDGKDCLINVLGDGVIVVKPKNQDRFYMYAISYSKNRPEYIAYAAQDDRREMYLSGTDNTKTVTSYVPVDEDRFTIYESEPAATRMQPEAVHGEFEWVGVASDGIQSFYRMVETGGGLIQEPVPLEQVALKLFDFRGKSLTGKFVQRRMTRFLRDAAKLGWINDDDLSFGVVSFL